MTIFPLIFAQAHELRSLRPDLSHEREEAEVYLDDQCDQHKGAQYRVHRKKDGLDICEVYHKGHLWENSQQYERGQLGHFLSHVAGNAVVQSDNFKDTPYSHSTDTYFLIVIQYLGK